MFIDYMMTRVHLGLIVINRNECVAGEDMFYLTFLPYVLDHLEIVLGNLSKT